MPASVVGSPDDGDDKECGVHASSCLLPYLYWCLRGFAHASPPPQRPPFSCLALLRRDPQDGSRLSAQSLLPTNPSRPFRPLHSTFWASRLDQHLGYQRSPWSLSSISCPSSLSASLAAFHNPGTVPSPRSQQQKGLESPSSFAFAQVAREPLPSRSSPRVVSFCGPLPSRLACQQGSFCSVRPHFARDSPRCKTPYSLSPPTLACKRRHPLPKKLAPCLIGPFN